MYCVHHEREIPISACRLCYKMACNECDKDVEDCTGNTILYIIDMSMGDV